MDQSKHEFENGLFRTALELSKARLSILVVWTTATGAIAAQGENHPFQWKTLLLTVAGTAVAAAAASVLNQVLEAHRDAQMERTEQRPIPRGAIGQRAAWLLGLGLTTTSIVLLWPVGRWPLWLAMGTIALYAAVYTPPEATHQFEYLGGGGGWRGPSHDWMGGRARRSGRRSLGFGRNFVCVANPSLPGSGLDVSR